MDYIKQLFSIQEKKMSLLGILLIIIIGYTLYSHYINKDIIILVNMVQSFLFAFVGVNGFSVLDEYLSYKNKLNNINNDNVYVNENKNSLNNKI